MLSDSSVPLCEAYDLAMLDLDGVVYIGPAVVPGVPDRLARAREAGMRLAFVTNNAARPPASVASHLVELGIAAEASDVVTSAQAAASLLAARLPPGSKVFLLGGEGLDAALRERGLEPVSRLGDDPVAVVSGYGPDLPWRRIMQGAILVRGGLPWVASNTDLTIPTDFGLGPGHGVLVRMLRDFTGVEPQVAGKPQRPLLDETIARVGGRRPLMVGDRLDTDILGAHHAGVDSLLVMTGVTHLEELVFAPADQRPAYLAADLEGLLRPQPAPRRTHAGWTAGGWSTSVVDGVLRVDGDGGVDDWWRCVASAAWDHVDGDGSPVRFGHLSPPVADTAGRGR